MSKLSCLVLAAVAISTSNGFTVPVLHTHTNPRAVPTRHDHCCHLQQYGSMLPQVSNVMSGTREVARTTTMSCTILAMSTTNSNPEEQSSKKQKPSIIISIASTTAIIGIDIAFRKLLKAYSIAFPSALAGCGSLFTAMVAIYTVKPALGDSIYTLLAPGSAVLAKWLPVFFVPSLVTLPLAQSLGSSMEVLKVAAVIVMGFFFTLFSTSLSVLGVKTLTGANKDEKQQKQAPIAATTTTTSKPTIKAFSDRTSKGLAVSSLISAMASVVAVNYTSLPAVATTPLQAIAMLFITLSTFTYGARLPKSFTKKIHPLITCTTLTWTAMSLFAKLTSRSFRDMLTSYKVSSMCPVHLGAGDILLFMLGPAVVALSCQMYDRKQLMKENLLEVGTAIGVSSVGGLFGTAFMVNALQISSPILRKCALSRNITSPLAMAIAGILGADVSLAVSMVVVTGLFGANFGAAILDAAGIKDAVARGMGIGAAAHGLGTAAFANEEDAFPFAAISMALTASACTVLVSIPVVKKLILKVALGA